MANRSILETRDKMVVFRVRFPRESRDKWGANCVTSKHADDVDDVCDVDLGDFPSQPAAFAAAYAYASNHPGRL